MTVLILAQKKIKDLLPQTIFDKIDFNFAFPNNKQGRVISTGFLIISVLAVVLYFGSLYFTFQTGFGLREQEILIDKLDREVKLQEVQASNMETALAGDLEVLSVMEKISSIRFIKTSSEVSYK
ncbi:MAG: hypothetical protein Q8R29_02775 [bacterium]|nr:hypothetical protein [bacterium]